MFGQFQVKKKVIKNDLAHKKCEENLLIREDQKLSKIILLDRTSFRDFLNFNGQSKSIVIFTKHRNFTMAEAHITVKVKKISKKAFEDAKYQTNLGLALVILLQEKRGDGPFKTVRLYVIKNNTDIDGLQHPEVRPDHFQNFPTFASASIHFDPELQRQFKFLLYPIDTLFENFRIFLAEPTKKPTSVYAQDGILKITEVNEKLLAKKLSKLETKSYYSYTVLINELAKYCYSRDHFNQEQLKETSMESTVEDKRIDIYYSFKLNVNQKAIHDEKLIRILTGGLPNQVENEESDYESFKGLEAGKSHRILRNTSSNKKVIRQKGHTLKIAFLEDLVYCQVSGEACGAIQGQESVYQCANCNFIVKFSFISAISRNQICKACDPHDLELMEDQFPERSLDKLKAERNKKIDPITIKPQHNLETVGMELCRYAFKCSQTNKTISFYNSYRKCVYEDCKMRFCFDIEITKECKSREAKVLAMKATVEKETDRLILEKLKIIKSHSSQKSSGQPKPSTGSHYKAVNKRQNFDYNFISYASVMGITERTGKNNTDGTDIEDYSYTVIPASFSNKMKKTRKTEMALSNFHCYKILGQGTYGVVYKTRVWQKGRGKKLSSMVYAIKQLRVPSGF